ncbi:MAG TPA: hypothetical protein PLR71_07150, partial [Deltaproteobacteria bacterium]|nr:hypothetical protein [Deltaproteobacteria bacterium]
MAIIRLRKMNVVRQYRTAFLMDLERMRPYGINGASVINGIKDVLMRADMLPSSVLPFSPIYLSLTLSSTCCISGDRKYS